MQESKRESTDGVKSMKRGKAHVRISESQSLRVCSESGWDGVNFFTAASMVLCFGSVMKTVDSTPML